MAACNECLWEDQCSTDEECAYFTPIEERDVEEVIEERRREFYKDWEKCNNL